MGTKKFILCLVAIVGLTAVAITVFKCATEVQTKRYEAKNFEPLCEHRGGSFTTPRYQQHHYRHRRYRRPLPVKTYFKYIPPPPRRHKIKRRRNVRNRC